MDASVHRRLREGAVLETAINSGDDVSESFLNGTTHSATAS
jgi:hypothetical protein